MSKIHFFAAGLLSIGLAGLPGTSSAAVIQTAQELLTVCPALSDTTGCPEGARDYLAAAHPSNGAIVELVNSIATAGDTPKVPKRICLDAAQGIRVLAGGDSDADQRKQILLVADAMCRGATTAAIPPTGNDTGNGNGGNSNNDGVGGTGDNGGGGNGGGDGGGNGGGDGGGNGGGNGGGDGGGDGACAGNSSPGNGNNCNNPNQSHSH